MPHSHALQTFIAALIWTSVFAGMALLWLLRDVVLIILGAILAALLLSISAEQISRFTHLSRRWALLIAVLAITALLGGVIWLFGAQLSAQLADVLDRVEGAEEQIMGMLQSQENGLLARLISGGGSVLSEALTYFAATMLNFIEGFVIIVISALYLASSPQVYQSGLITLFPPRFHQWAEHVVETIGTTLRLWLVGQLFLMLITGLLSFIAAWSIGLPSPIGLAVIAGLTEIIPYLGPIIGAVPALLVALTLGLWPVIWTVIAYTGIHLVEGYLAAPLIQERFVKIPPAVMLIGITASGMIFGLIGVLFAAPLTVMIFVTVKLLYVRETLDEETELPGEDEAAE